MPLIKAAPGQEPALLASATQEPLYNLFLISNLLEGLGPHIEAWTDGRGGILMRRYANWLCEPGPDPEAFDWAAAAAMLDARPPAEVRGLTGRPAAVEPLFRLLRNHPARLVAQHFAALQEPPAPIEYVGTARPARLDDLDALAAMYADAGDMTRGREAVERSVPYTWVLEDGGDIVAAAGVSGRTPQAAMIGAVFTPVALRKRGFASTLVHAMSVALYGEGRMPCLFYHNPEAGRIYLRLGYRDLGPWQMCRFA